MSWIKLFSYIMYWRRTCYICTFTLRLCSSLSFKGSPLSQHPPASLNVWLESFIQHLDSFKVLMLMSVRIKISGRFLMKHVWNCSQQKKVRAWRVCDAWERWPKSRLHWYLIIIFLLLRDDQPLRAQWCLDRVRRSPSLTSELLPAGRGSVPRTDWLLLSTLRPPSPSPEANSGSSEEFCGIYAPSPG